MFSSAPSTMSNFPLCIKEYDVGDLLGSGGFANVYRARVRRTGQEVAIKMIETKRIREEGLESRVKQEVSLHTRMDHPSVVKVYACFEDDLYIYLVLELCHNGGLDKYLKKYRLSEKQACILFRQIVEGLKYLHRNNVMHRDLSLSNIVLTEDLNVKIADLGLAKQLKSAHEKHFTMCGTRNYMPPEAVTNAGHGLERDVWSLGVLLYYMLAESPPFGKHASVPHLDFEIVMTDPNFPRSMSDEARDLLELMLKKDPTQRIQLHQILEHPFLRMSFAHPGIEPKNRMQFHDSGISSSCQTPSVAYSQQSDCHSTARVVPVLNGALRRQRPVSPPRSVQERSYASCCNGHLPNSARRDDCSHCFRSVEHVCVKNVLQESPRRQDESYEDYAISRPGSVPLIHGNTRSNNHQFPVAQSTKLSDFYAEQPKSYVNECGSAINLGNPNCSHAFRTCTRDQCTHIDACSCQHGKTSACKGIISRSGPSLNSHSQDFQGRRTALSGDFSGESKLGGTVNGSLNGTCQHYSNTNGSSMSINHPRIQISPIFSKRLRPVRQKTKRVIFNILNNSDVCLEFLKIKNGVEEVSKVLQISSDGMRIVVYRPRGVAVGPVPPALPNEGPDTICSYENIPEKLWKEYTSASKFVSLVKSKTPKVTYYSGEGKCFLMENGPDADFEVCFYEGGKVTKTANDIKLIECNGKSSSFDMRSTPMLSNSCQHMWAHFLKCLEHCKRLEATMESLAQDPDEPCFPLIVGRRPQQYSRTQSVAGNKGKENMPMPSNLNVLTMGGFETSAVSTRPGSSASKCKEPKLIKECDVVGIGRARQFSNGDIHVLYSNGSRLELYSKPKPAKVSYVSDSGKRQEYEEKDGIPGDIVSKLGQIPGIVEVLKASA